MPTNDFLDNTQREKGSEYFCLYEALSYLRQIVNWKTSQRFVGKFQKVSQKSKIIKNNGIDKQPENESKKTLPYIKSSEKSKLEAN